MRIQSAKAKGRRAAEELRQALLLAFPDLTEDDIRTCPSSVNGPDLWMSKSAKEKIPFSIECKNQEKLNIWDALSQNAISATAEKLSPLLCFRRNRSPLRVVLDLNHFLELLQQMSLFSLLEAKKRCERRIPILLTKAAKEIAYEIKLNLPLRFHLKNPWLTRCVRWTASHTGEPSKVFISQHYMKVHEEGGLHGPGLVQGSELQKKHRRRYQMPSEILKRKNVFHIEDRGIYERIAGGKLRVWYRYTTKRSFRKRLEMRETAQKIVSRYSGISLLS